MAAIDIIDILVRWMHILPALTMVGATIFMRFALHPSLGTLPDSQRAELQAAVRGRWSKVVMASIGLLLLSGIINIGLMATRGQLPGGLYHPLLAIKILLALVVFYIASLLVGRSGTADKIRRNASFWLTLNVVLAVTVVCIAGVMRSADHSPKPKPAATERKEIADVAQYTPQSHSGAFAELGVEVRELFLWRC
jgi:uncharacterized membrane protein